MLQTNNFLLVEQILVMIVIVFSPLISGVILLLFGHFVSRPLGLFFNLAHMAVPLAAASVFFFQQTFVQTTGHVCLYQWACVNALKIDIVFSFDNLNVTMIFLVLSVSFLVHLYSIHYMRNDVFQLSFMCFLSIFTFFMLILVAADNFILFFFGWEGVGLCSYILVNFWSTRVQANKSALKAMVVNRIGDVFLLLAFALLYDNVGTLDFDIIFSFMFFNDFFHDLSIPLNGINGLLFVGSLAKSSQIGLHSWLPDAMEGPTPVSALIHAATMVTAGVFLLIRCSSLFEHTTVVNIFVVLVGSLTCVLAGLIGSCQVDVKKLIAYSTMSQLGYMYMGCGLSCYQEAFFHLWIHGFIKALLFLGVGVVIHYLGDEQNMFRMGKLIHFFPHVFILLFFASASLMALPFFSGYFSKHVLLEMFYNHSYVGYFAYSAGVLGSFLTGLYSTKLLLFVFFGSFRNPVMSCQQLNSLGYINHFLYIPLFVLFIPSVLFGGFFNPLVLDIGGDFMFSKVRIQAPNYLKIEAEHLDFYVTQFPLFFSLLGVIFAVIYFCHIQYGIRVSISMSLKKLKKLFFTLLGLTVTLIFYSLNIVKIIAALIRYYPYASQRSRVVAYLVLPPLICLLFVKICIKVLELVIIITVIVMLFYLGNILRGMIYRFLPRSKYVWYPWSVKRIIACFHFIFLFFYAPFFARIILALLLRYIYWLKIFSDIMWLRMRHSSAWVVFHTIYLSFFSRLYKLCWLVPEKTGKKYVSFDYYCFDSMLLVHSYSQFRLHLRNLAVLNFRFAIVARCFSRGLFFDKMVNELLNKPFVLMGWSYLFRLFDKGLLEAVIGPVGLGRVTLRCANFVSNFQTGLLFDYICSLLVSGLAVLIFSYVFF